MSSGQIVINWTLEDGSEDLPEGEAVDWNLELVPPGAASDEQIAAILREVADRL